MIGFSCYNHLTLDIGTRHIILEKLTHKHQDEALKLQKFESYIKLSYLRMLIDTNRGLRVVQMAIIVSKLPRASAHHELVHTTS